LTTIDLDRSQITDSAVESLSTLKHLRSLHLRGTAVTDAGLKFLEPHTGLQSLNLENTDVSESGVETLQETLPNCRIVVSSADSLDADAKEELDDKD